MYRANVTATFTMTDLLHCQKVAPEMYIKLNPPLYITASE
jgi:hypothetical protein